jgi:hypothetical protein
MYTTLDIAYNDNTAELDKMAREINNKKKTLFKSVENDYFNKQKKWENDIIEYNNSYKNPYGHFTNHPNEKTEKIQKMNNTDDISINTDTDFSLESSGTLGSSNILESSDILDSMGSLDSISIDSPSLDSYIDSVKKQPHKKKSIHSFIKKLDHDSCSKNEDDIFTHVKYCYDCREKLLKYMKKEVKNKHKDNNKSIIDYININKESLFNYSGTLEIKEIFLIIMLGVILIIFLDFLIKSPYSIR